ncbi:MAG: MarP family serine protease [Actinobacteria bacterium]|nr:MarP family serine protease [Actinomycetota bacterium]MCL5445560.1 MarP family serine protease [Actinomycetota bacterium]
MNVVDIVILVIVVGSALHGLRLGALAQISTFVGFLAGIALGTFLALLEAPHLSSPEPRIAVVIVLIIFPAMLFAALGRYAGLRSNSVLRRHHLGAIDSALGVTFAVISVLLSVWILAYLVSNTRYTWLSAAVQRSAIVRGLDNVMPAAPSTLTQVQSFLSDEGFPPVFSGLTPLSTSRVATPSSAQAQLIAARASSSTFKITGSACGYLLEGTGFVVAPGLLLTNAHVIAGETHTQVWDAGTPYPATPILFDPNFDVALLRTTAPLAAPLQLDSAPVQRGTSAAVVGFPENGGLTTTPAGVAANLTARGPNIYSQGSVVRSIYEIDATVRPGNSGGPLVAQNGQVIGVVFSRSTVDPSVGFALTSPGVLRHVISALSDTSAVRTGQCVLG